MNIFDYKQKSLLGTSFIIDSCFHAIQQANLIKVTEKWDKCQLNNTQEFQSASLLLANYDDKTLFKCIKRVIDSADIFTYEERQDLLKLIQILQQTNKQNLSIYEIRFFIQEIANSYDCSAVTSTINSLAMLNQILFQMNRIDEAISVWLEFIGLEPQSILGYQKQAQFLSKLNKQDQALAIWNLFLKNNPEDEFQCCQQKAQLLFVQFNEFEESLQIWDNYIQKNPNYLEAYCQKADLLHQMFEVDKALEVYDCFIEKHPGDFKAYKMKTELLVSLNQFDKAIEEWEKYMTIYPRDKKAYEKMVMIVNLKYQ